MNYVLGFLFRVIHEHQQFTEVALIEKKRPAWMEGMLNGIGGKIEIGEEPLHAMTREFKEETGAIVLNWTEVGSMRFGDSNIFLFKSQGFPALKSKTDEDVRWVPISQIKFLPVVPNLHWIIPMCLYDPDYVHQIVESKRED